MGEIEDGRQGIKPLKESPEDNARELLSLRIQFAQAISRLSGTPLPDVLFKYTDLYRRFGFGDQPPDEDDANPEWIAYKKQMENAPDPLAVTVTYLLPRAERLGIKREMFGPFSYEYDEKKNEVELHFGNMNWLRAEDPLGGFSVPQIRKEFTRMLSSVQAQHPEARYVGGRSWFWGRLLESPILRRMLTEVLPASFLDNAGPSPGRYQGGGRWGQFTGSGGKVHAKRKEEFLRRLEKISLDKVDDVFPIQPIEMKAPIEDFYRFYGIK